MILILFDLFDLFVRICLFKWRSTPCVPTCTGWKTGWQVGKPSKIGRVATVAVDTSACFSQLQTFAFG